MRVTHVIFNLVIGGTELMLTDIIAQQVRQGAQVSLVLINSEQDERVLARIPKEVQILRVGRSLGSKNPWWALKYNLALRSTRPDVVHFHNDKAPGLTLRRKGVKYVGTVHATGVQLHYYLKKLDRVFAISEAVRADIMARYAKDSTVVYNGIDTGLPQRRAARGAVPSLLRIVTVGRLYHKVKGQDIVLQALSLLPPEYAGRFAVDIIGDGPSLGFLRDMASEHGIDKAVNFLGAKDRKWVYASLKDYDLFVQPSRQEGFGLSVVEAMAAKLPVLVSDLDGIQEVVKGGEMGMMFQAGSPQALRDKLVEAYNDYENIEKRAGGRAYDWATSNFDISSTARNYLAEYDRL